MFPREKRGPGQGEFRRGHGIPRALQAAEHSLLLKHPPHAVPAAPNGETGDETQGMNQRRGQERSSSALSSQHLGRSEQQGLRLPERSSGVRGIWGTGEDRELLVLRMCACVIGLL